MVKEPEPRPLVLKAVSHIFLFDFVFNICLSNIVNYYPVFIKISSAQFMGKFTIFRSNILLCFCSKWVK